MARPVRVERRLAVRTPAVGVDLRVYQAHVRDRLSVIRHRMTQKTSDLQFEHARISP